MKKTALLVAFALCINSSLFGTESIKIVDERYGKLPDDKREIVVKFLDGIRSRVDGQVAENVFHEAMTYELANWSDISRETMSAEDLAGVLSESMAEEIARGLVNYPNADEIERIRQNVNYLTEQTKIMVLNWYKSQGTFLVHELFWNNVLRHGSRQVETDWNKYGGGLNTGSEEDQLRAVVYGRMLRAVLMNRMELFMSSLEQRNQTTILSPTADHDWWLSVDSLIIDERLSALQSILAESPVVITGPFHEIELYSVIMRYIEAPGPENGQHVKELLDFDDAEKILTISTERIKWSNED